jgi:hypothetical protein
MMKCIMYNKNQALKYGAIKSKVVSWKLFVGCVCIKDSRVWLSSLTALGTDCPESGWGPRYYSVYSGRGPNRHRAPLSNGTELGRHVAGRWPGPVSGWEFETESPRAEAAPTSTSLAPDTKDGKPRE